MDGDDEGGHFPLPHVSLSARGDIIESEIKCLCRWRENFNGLGLSLFPPIWHSTSGKHPSPVCKSPTAFTRMCVCVRFSSDSPITSVHYSYSLAYHHTDASQYLRCILFWIFVYKCFYSVIWFYTVPLFMSFFVKNETINVQHKSTSVNFRASMMCVGYSSNSTSSPYL